MRPAKLQKGRAFGLFGILLAANSLAYAQVTPPVVPPRLSGAPNLSLGGGFPCGQNVRGLTTLEQLQNGATYSDIIQQEQRAVACKVNPAVVEVIASGFGAVPGQEYETLASATPGPSIGSGVIISADGYIVTNRHVIKGAPRVTIVLHMNGKLDEQVIAEIKGQDEKTDIALLKIEREGLPFLQFNLQQVQQGDTVYAFGSPHGVGNSMTKGLISASVRQVEERDQVDYIQTDAAINPGNSGGALVDVQGRLVGINTFILSATGGNEGLNFAIPANVVSYIADRLKENGYVIRGDIGIHTRNLTPELIQTLSLPVQVGVYVEDVDVGGPADTAGIKFGDIVVSVVGFPPFTGRSPDPALDLDRAIYGTKKGQEIRLNVLPKGSTTVKTYNVVVNQLSPEPSGLSPQLTNDQIIDQLGIYALQMSPNSAAGRRLRIPRGVLVASKVQTMAAPLSDLQVGDVINEINGKPVSGPDDLRQVLDSAAAGSTVALQVERDKKIKLMLITIN